jgi:hypothetical protein
MNEPATKTCPLCREPVHPEARKCPHCQHYLNKWVLANFHPLIIISPVLLVFGAIFIWLMHTLDRGESFEPFRSQLQITHSEMQFGELPTGPTVAVIGTIHNESNVAWKYINVEVRYFDKSHKLIDTQQRPEYSLSVPPKGDCAFKVSHLREFKLADYASHEVHIVGSHDANGFLR